MSLSNFARMVGVLLAVLLCASSAGTKPAVNGGASRTQKQGTFYKTKPRFEWPGGKGANYRVVLWRLPSIAGQQRVAVYDILNHSERSWVPPDDLDFQTRYELFVYNEAMAIVTSWGFTIGFQPPTVIYPQPNAKVRNLSPEIRINPSDYPYVFYSFEISEAPTFDKIAEEGWVAHQENVRTFPGLDKELGTPDDIRFLSWSTRQVLAPNKTYFWRVRSYYYSQADLATTPKPLKENAEGKAESTGSFTIPAQSGSDSLANVTQITRDSANTMQPALNKKYDLSYISQNPDESSEIRVAGVQVQRGTPVFDTGREEFTKSVKGSKDRWPQWDVDGEGLFFSSDRSQGTANVWYKRRDARGYTQLTFHNVPAEAPSISKDGNRVAYQVRNNENGTGSAIWVVGRDGRSATELGAGEQPKFSPDGRRIAFAMADFLGVKQIWIMDANGGNRVQITNEACTEGQACEGSQSPVWHPQGNRLIFVSDTKSGNNDLWMAETEGARMVQLTNYLGEDIDPEFTADGRYLLFASRRGGKIFHIWMGEFAVN